MPSLLPPEEILFGTSAAMAAVRRQLEKVSQTTDVSVLICGAAGTGKELIARWIHEHSVHAAGRFVKISCGAIPGTLLESELFGYEKGAFTGAHTSKPGWVEMAHLGTLFLDEIAALEPRLQAKVLHFLQDGRFSRLGSNDEKSVVLQVITATSRDLDAEMSAGRFRPDLYYRISTLQIKLPSLDQRRQDIPNMAEYFADQYRRQFAKSSDSLSPPLLDYLSNVRWPGNIRELSNAIARYVLLGQDAFPPAEPQLRPREPAAATTARPTLKNIAGKAIRELEREIILEALRSNQWNRRRTAAELKISYRALIYKIRDAGLISRPLRRPGQA